MIDPRTTEIERLMLQRRLLSMQLLNLDAYDKWGAPHDTDEGRQKMFAEGAKMETEYNELTTQIESLVTQMRAEAPEAIIAWADAHITLLTEFMEAMGEGDDKRTERYVADDERAQWRKVREGSQVFVSENVYYVHVDPARHRELLGE